MILVTGSAGYIGSHLIKKLHLNNVKFLGIDNLSYSKKENIYNKQKFIKTDIGNILVTSSKNKGTEFLITLPII